MRAAIYLVPTTGPQYRDFNTGRVLSGSNELPPPPPISQEPPQNMNNRVTLRQSSIKEFMQIIHNPER